MLKKHEALDAVVTVNLFMKFNGTTEEVRVWIDQNDPEKLDKYHQVCIGGGDAPEYVGILEYMRMTAP